MSRVVLSIEWMVWNAVCITVSLITFINIYSFLTHFQALLRWLKFVFNNNLPLEMVWSCSCRCPRPTRSWPRRTLGGWRWRRRLWLGSRTSRLAARRRARRSWTGTNNIQWEMMTSDCWPKRNPTRHHGLDCLESPRNQRYILTLWNFLAIFDNKCANQKLIYF